MDRLAFAKGGFDGLKGLDSGSNSGHGMVNTNDMVWGTAFANR